MRPIALFLLAAAGNSWWAHVQFLASDQLQGRQTGSKGYEAAADYVVRQFERAGLKATSQPVEMTKTTLEETQSSITLVRESRATPITLGDDAILRWDASAVPDVAPESGAPLVFAGYGLDIPETGYSDLKDPALRGAIVVYLTGGPSDISGISARIILRPPNEPEPCALPAPSAGSPSPIRAPWTCRGRVSPPTGFSRACRLPIPRFNPAPVISSPPGIPQRPTNCSKAPATPSPKFSTPPITIARFRTSPFHRGSVHTSRHIANPYIRAMLWACAQALATKSL